MSKSTKSVVTLDGVTAAQMSEMLAQKSVTKAQVVAYLTEKEGRVGLRFPARQLLAELTGKAPAKADESKPVAQKPVAKAQEVAPVKPVAKADDLAEIIGKAVAGALAPVLARLDAVEAKLATPVKATEPTKPEPTNPEPVKPEPVKAAPAKGPNPTSVPVAQKRVAKLPTEEEVRAGMDDMTVAELRERAKEFGIDVPAKGGKDAVIDAIIADALASGVIVAAAPVKVAAKPNLKVVRADEVTF